jgi:hypothetical protein
MKTIPAELRDDFRRLWAETLVAEAGDERQI